MSGLPRWLSGKESTCNAGYMDSIPELGRFPWMRKWQPTSVLLAGESHEQGILDGYSPHSHKDSDSIEAIDHVRIMCLVLF